MTNTDLTRGERWSPKGVAAFIADMQSEAGEAKRQAHRDAEKAHKAKKAKAKAEAAQGDA